MGILIGGIALLVGGVSLVAGLVGFLIHRRARAENGRGSWLLYCAIAGMTALAVFKAAELSFLSSTGGAPSEEDYLNVIAAFSLAAAAPGAGLLAGALAALKPKASVESGSDHV